MLRNVKKMTINLKAPVIINAGTNKGAQCIIDGAGYNVRHLLSDELERSKSLSNDTDRPENAMAGENQAAV